MDDWFGVGPPGQMARTTTTTTKALMEPCGICGKKIAVNPLGGDKRRMRDGTVRCVEHIGVEKVE